MRPFAIYMAWEGDMRPSTVKGYSCSIALDMLDSATCVFLYDLHRPNNCSLLDIGRFLRTKRRAELSESVD